MVRALGWRGQKGGREGAVVQDDECSVAEWCVVLLLVVFENKTDLISRFTAKQARKLLGLSFD